MSLGDRRLHYALSIGSMPGIPYAPPEEGLSGDDWVPLLRGEIRPDEAIVFHKVSKGRITSDVVWTRTVSLHVVSRRVIEALRAAGCTGWATYPATIKLRDGTLTAPGDFAGLAITGRAGPVDWSTSRVTYERMVDRGPLSAFYNGVELSDWDGTDIVLAGETGHKFCTPRFYHAIRDAQVRGFAFEPMRFWRVWEHSVGPRPQPPPPVPQSRLRAVAAVHLFLIRDNSILLLRRANTGYEDGNYSVPAGHLEPRENPEQAMLREALEETGIWLAPLDLDFALVMARQSAEPRVDFFFTATKWEGEPENREPAKCDELRWASLDDLPRNVVPYVRLAMENFRAGERYVEMRE